MASMGDWLLSLYLPNITTDYVQWDFTPTPTIEPFWFERMLNLTASRKWWWNHSHVVIQIALGYIILSHFLVWWMKDRKPYALQRELAIWNFGMATASAFAWCRIAPELYHVLRGEDGWHRSVCVRDTLNVSSGFWMVISYWSKFFEFVDTIFIILRKRPLIFLHWYHHAATYIMCVSSVVQAEPILRYYASLNLFVHTIMYTYFGLTTLGYKPPRIFAMSLTSIQIIQFVIGLLANLYGLWVKWNGQPCAMSKESSRLTMIVVFSYIVLFSRFFYKTYLSGKQKKRV